MCHEMTGIRFDCLRMSERPQSQTIGPICKGERNIQNCENYERIKLISYTMKLWETVIDRRLRATTNIKVNQFVFTPAKFTMNRIFILRQAME